MNTSVPPVQKWHDFFLKEPTAAIEDLLTKKFYMGTLHRNDADEIVYRLFHTRSASEQQQLDCVVYEWLNHNLKTGGPPSLSAARWAETLQNTFSVVVRLDLTQTQNWLLKNHQQIRSWLHPLYQGPAQDPEADFLRTLALIQKNQLLLPLWMRLCRLEEARPLYFATLGLMGLCKLPENTGELQGDLPPALFSGIIELAEAINRQVRTKKEGELFWATRVKSIMVRYPRTTQYCKKHFIPLLIYKTDSIALKYLNKIIPEIKKASVEDRNSQIQAIQPPSKFERDQLITLIDKFPLHTIRPKLDPFLDRHRKYALNTGYAEFLVKTFNSIGYKIRTKSPEFSRQLIQEAFEWAPENPFLWNSLAKVEALLGNHRRAQVLLWQARRKFPENVRIRTDLARLLKNLNQFDHAGLVYRQAIIDFPDNAVCRTGLAEVLKAQGRLVEAETVYSQTMIDFPDNAYCQVGLATIYLQKHETEKAIQLLREAHRNFPNNQIIINILVKIDEEFSSEELIKLIEGFQVDLSYTELDEDIDFDENSESGVPVKGARIEELSPVDTSVFAANLIQDQENFTETGEKESAALTRLDGCEICDLNDDESATDEIHKGLANLFRLAAQQFSATDQVNFEENFLQICEKLLQKNPNNLTILLEKGFWMLDHQKSTALEFYKQQVFESKNVNVLGLKLGYLLAKFQQQAELNPAEWEKLLPEHHDRATLIKLEFARQTCIQGNGMALGALEDLRKQLHQDIDFLPGNLHQKEKWLRENIETTIFENQELNVPITFSRLPQLTNNFLRHELKFRSISQQCLASIS